MIRVFVDQLEEGMVVAKDVHDHRDVVLVPAGTVLTPDVIGKINGQTLYYIYIDVPNTTEQSIQLERDILEGSMKASINSFKSIYKNLKEGKRQIRDEVEVAIEPIIQLIEKNYDLAKKLWEIEVTDAYTFDHSVRVCLMSALIGKWMNLSKERIHDVAIAGLLHDTGKCRVPEGILNKPGKLTPEEYELMKGHPEAGLKILSEVPGISPLVLKGVYEHHERIDGTGYPRGLTNSNISMVAKIIAIADVYSAMTTDRVYRIKSSPFEAAEAMMDQLFTGLDPLLSRKFLSRLSQFYVGSHVLLNDGRVARVVMNNKYTPSKPLVLAGDDFIDLATTDQVAIASIVF